MSVYQIRRWEAKERVKTALVNSGFAFPQKKIIVNLAPADLPKEGSAFDLAIAVGILVANGDLEIEIEKVFFWGVIPRRKPRHTKGTLLVALFAKKEKRKSICSHFIGQ